MDNTKQAWETRLRSAAGEMEAEVHRMIAYMNDKVVPEVRRNGSDALHAAATELRKLAERVDAANRQGPPPPES